LWLAALLILIGVVLSYAMRTWQKRGRPRLFAQRDIQALLEEIESITTEARPSTAEVDPLNILRQRLEKLYEQIDTAIPPTLDADLKEIGGKIALYPDWLNRRRQVDAIRPRSLAVPFITALEKILAFLTSSTDKTDPQTHRTTLTTMPADIKAAVEAEFKTKFDALQSELKSHRVKVTPATSAILKRIDEALRQATVSIDSGDLVDARTQFNLARADYVRLLLQELDEQLSGPTPVGFSAAQWSELGASMQSDILGLRTLAGTDPDQAMESYKITMCRLFRQLAGALVAQAPLIRTQLETITDAAKQKAALEKLDHAVGVLNSAANKAGDGNLADAAKDYEDGSQKFEQCRAEISSAGGQQDAAGNIVRASVAEATAGAILVGSAGQSAIQLITSRRHAVRPSVEDLKKQIECAERWFTFVLFLIATVIGINMFWVGNLTWGGWPAWLTALIWGLGVHQASGTALDLVALGDKFK
jgi:hypothetical protein